MPLVYILLLFSYIQSHFVLISHLKVLKDMHTYTLLVLMMLFGLFIPSTGNASDQKNEPSQAQRERLLHLSLPLRLTTNLQTPAPEKKQDVVPASNNDRTQTSRNQVRQMTPVQASPAPKNQTPRLEKSATELIRLAESRWQQGNLEQAKTLYKTLLKQFPNYPYNHLIMIRVADALQRQESLGAALKLYGKIVDTYPGSQGALISQIRMAELGLTSPGLLPKPGNPTFATYHQPIKGLQALIQRYPADQLADIARFKIADYKLEAGKFNTALPLLRYLSEKQLPANLIPLVQDKLGQAIQQQLVALQEQEAYPEVLQTFYSYRPLLRVQDIMSPKIILPVAISYARLGLFVEAESLLQWLLTVNPTEMPKTLQGSDQENALVLVEQSRQGTPPLSATETAAMRSKVLLHLGDWALQNGRPDKAIGYLKQADPAVLERRNRLRLYAFLTVAYTARGDLLNGTRIVQKCLGLLTGKTINDAPESELCLRHAAELMFNDHQYAAALKTYQKLLQAFPQSAYRAQALFHMSLIHQELGKWEDATKDLEMLRDTGSSALWQKVAIDALNHLSWQKSLHTRLTALQNDAL